VKKQMLYTLNADRHKRRKTTSPVEILSFSNRDVEYYFTTCNFLAVIPADEVICRRYNPAEREETSNLNSVFRFVAIEETHLPDKSNTAIFSNRSPEEDWMMT
jgi:hypothetical protein